MKVKSRRFLQSKQLFEVKLEGGEKLWVQPEDEDAIAGDEIPSARWGALLATSEYLHARDYALRLLGRREYFQGELKDRLFRKGFRGRTIGRVLSELTEDDYLNDDRAARTLVSERLARGGIGPLKMVAQLTEKGYEKSRARELVAELLPADFEEQEIQKFISRRAKSYRERMERELQETLADEEKCRKLGGEVGIKHRLRAKYQGKIYTKLRAAGFSTEFASRAAREIISS